MSSRAGFLPRVVLAVAVLGGCMMSARAEIVWTNYTTGSGQGNNSVRGVYATGSTIYAATKTGP